MSNLKKEKDYGFILEKKTMINRDKLNWDDLVGGKWVNKSLESFLEVTLAKVGFSYVSIVKINALNHCKS